MIAIREARPDELPELMTIIDGAYLAVDQSLVEASLDDGTVLVATGDQQIVGTIVLTSSPHFRDTSDESPLHVHAVAVRRARRDQGIGRALVSAAMDRTHTLTATFDERVKPFYCSLGFEIAGASGAQYWGVLGQSDGD